MMKRTNGFKQVGAVRGVTAALATALTVVLAGGLLGGCSTGTGQASSGARYRLAPPTVKPWAENARLGRARAGLDQADVWANFSGFAMAGDGMGARVERKVQVARAQRLRSSPTSSPVRVEFATVPALNNEP
jgi:hypothetical protein